MGFWKQPKPTFLRRALFQIHLWVAIAIGLYVVVISVSGSAVVFRRELNVWLVPRSVVVDGPRLTADELRAAAERAYPGHTIVEIREPPRPERPVLVGLQRGAAASERLFDPYRGTDLGLAFPPVLRAVEWLVDLHDNLLSGQIGRIANGIGGALVTVLLLTGAVIWWPGKAKWRDSLSPGRPRLTRRFAWRLHSFVGFWGFALLAVWASTAVYFAFPEPFEAAIDYFDTDLNDFYRPGEALLLGLIKLHFGRFGGLGVRVLWVLLGLLPAALFVTGFVMWWARVVRPARARLANSTVARRAVMERDAA
jgi:uncharacterized iron-regulated membrane protein